MSHHLRVVLACLMCSTYLGMMSLPVVDSFLSMKNEPNYIAQVKVFVDYDGYQKWSQATRKSGSANLRKNIMALFEDVEKLYESLGINFEIKDIVQLKYYDDVLKPNDRKIDTISAVYNFQQWIQKRYLKDDFDLALIFTGADLFSGSSYATYGVAYKGFVCQFNGIGVVEMFGKIPTSDKPSKEARLTAHEIGHILGSDHDQQYPKCSHKTGYLMDESTKLTESPNIYNFSSCSIDAIKKVMKQLNDNGTNCLLPNEIGLPEADKACQQREGVDWYFYRGYTSYGDNMCAEFKCATKITAQNRINIKKDIAPDGLACGKSKECQGGKCVVVKTGNPNIPDNCPYGNQNLKVLGYTHSCEGQDCRKGWQELCCAHCTDENN